MYCTPGPDNSNLIKTEKAVPNNPENNANIKYNTPISLALLDKNHLSNHKDIPLTFSRQAARFLSLFNVFNIFFNFQIFIFIFLFFD